MRQSFHCTEKKLIWIKKMIKECKSKLNTFVILEKLKTFTFNTPLGPKTRALTGRLQETTGKDDFHIKRFPNNDSYKSSYIKICCPYRHAFISCVSQDALKISA